MVALKFIEQITADSLSKTKTVQYPDNNLKMIDNKELDNIQQEFNFIEDNTFGIILEHLKTINQN